MKHDLLTHKTYLYLTEFFSGVSVMAVELGASRLMAPYFSSSQIVWTIIIATIMIAMALGNVYGGRTADKDPNPDRLYARLLIAAVWIAAIPVLGKYLILGITGLLVITVSENFLIIAAFAACMVIFVYPCFLLGTCTPSLVRYTATGLEDSGRTVGRLGACNTIGSIIGTFLPTFVTIPAVGTAVTFLIFSGVLLLISIIYFLSRGTGRLRCLIAGILFIACAFFGTRTGFAFWASNLAYEGESIYNYLQVQDDENSTILSTNVLFGVQSVTMKSDRLTGMYYDLAMAAPVMSGSQDHAKILILGMGTGTYARQCYRYLEDPTITGIEIDEKITELARTYFDEPAEAEVITYDGRAFLNVDDETYDVIMVDAYQDITIPFQMSSIDFFRLVKMHLKEDGVMVVNMNMRSSAEDGINTWLSDTIAAVFPSVVTVDVPYSTNRELFASETELSGELLAENAAAIADSELKALMLQTAGNLEEYRGGEHILTDDCAPVELLGMRAIDEIIQEELGYYRKLFKDEGIAGLLGEM